MQNYLGKKWLVEHEVCLTCLLLELSHIRVIHKVRASMDFCGRFLWLYSLPVIQPIVSLLKETQVNIVAQNMLQYDLFDWLFTQCICSAQNSSIVRY